jgi:hypothetical protein
MTHLLDRSHGIGTFFDPYYLTLTYIVREMEPS